MHIVFLTRRAWPAVGGVERHMFFLCQALKKIDQTIQISVITECSDASSSSSELYQGVQYYRFPLFPNLAQPNIKLSVFKGMLAHLNILQSADIIHVHDVFFWILPIWPVIFHKKIFMTFHGYEIPGPPNWRQQAWHQVAAFLTRGNICIGGFHHKWYGVKPTITSFGAVEESFAKEAKTAKLKQKRKLVFVGRLDHDTGIQAYLEAFALAKQLHHLDAELTIIGDGPLRSMLEQFGRDRDLDVIFLGQQKVTSQTYHEFDLSLGAGYLGILESLASGVPVVATYMTELKKDYLESLPIANLMTITRPGEELAAALASLPNISPKAQRWAASQTWTHLAEEYLRLWKTHG